ncbi:MAG: hypothetical protein JXB49_10560 [Bacteroidales bacterium]|nr:hypothetical protein [Bacteroidales bacterium]
MMKPHKTFFFLAVVLALLAIIALVFPKEGIKISENFTLRFKNIDDVLHPKEILYADINDIIDLSKNLEENDSIELLNEEITYDTIRANADSLKSRIFALEFPEDNHNILYPFFEKLKKSTKSRIVRIMHYGDSQIEGDRITGFLRNRLQKQFGGCGAGLVPAVQVYDFDYTLKQNNSENWKRYTIFGIRDTTLNHSRYGALAAFSRFTPVIPDSLISDSINQNAWISFEKSNLSFTNVRNYYQCRLFYSHNKRKVEAELYADDQLVESKSINPSKSLHTLRWTFDETPQKLEIKMSGSDSPDIYGVSFDGYTGVAVDNIAMRGCSGLIFTGMDLTLLKNMYQQLNTEMIILQFGGNMVPYLNKDYDFYERRFYQQLVTLKKIMPDVAIIVIGVADMSKKDGEYYVSYPNIKHIRDAMKNATFKAGCAYWDLYDAMGGENSMPSWVYAKPSLATSDFTHFNHRGARVVAEMFYKAFMSEYNIYLNSTQVEKLAQK